MAKFDYKKWVTKNKYGSLNEQANQQPGYYNVDTCHCNHYDESTNSCSQPLHNYNYVLLKDGATSKFPPYQYEPNPQVGGVVCGQIPQIPNVAGSCPESQQFRIVNITPGWDSGNGAIRNYRPEGCSSATTPDPVDPVDPDTGEEEGSFGTMGNYTVFDYPPGFNPSDWTANFIDMIINHPNPCNFLTQRITQFNTQLVTGNVGPLQANQLMQKIAVCQELFQMVGCGGMNEQISGIERYKLDPKAAAVIKRMAPQLRGLASKGRGVKKESKKMSTLKTIIKEALSKLKETKSNKN